MNNTTELINSIYCKIIALFNAKIGNLNYLTTTNKSTLVGSINEIKLNASSLTPYDYVGSINNAYETTGDSDYDPTLLGSFLPITLS